MFRWEGGGGIDGRCRFFQHTPTFRRASDEAAKLMVGDRVLIVLAVWKHAGRKENLVFFFHATPFFFTPAILLTFWLLSSAPLVCFCFVRLKQNADDRRYYCIIV